MLLANMWFQNLMRTFFHGIDKVIFNLIPDVYNFLIELARTSIITQADILDMADRIYKLLAVFMIFKVTFSLIMYVVNPDDFSDKSKGLSKLGVNIIISLSLLILTPYIFNYAYELQTYILEDNSLATLILGNKDDDSSKNAFNTAGDTMAYIVMTPFFTPNSAINGLYNCSSITVKNSENKIEFNEECSGLKNKDLTATGSSNVTLYSLAKENSKNFSLTTLKNYVTGVNNKNLGLTFRLDLATATIETNGEEVFVMDYKYLASAAIGVVTLLLLISFCMDVALRSIKLAFLQLIAPIPIISYVDPKSGKDGLFKKWYKMCFSTFLSLFVRLIALYFAVYIISRIDSLVDIIDGSYKSGAILKIFVVIGALMFAKQLPNILKGLGIKIEGADKFTLNPFKKFENEAIGGKKILGLGGATAAAGLAGATNFASRLFHPNSWKNDKGKFSLKKGLGNVALAPFSAIGGSVSAGYRGTKKALKGEGFGKTFTNSYGEAMFAKVQREDLKRKGSTLFGRTVADLNRITGNLNAAQRQELEYASIESEYKAKTKKLKESKEQLNRQKNITIQEKNDKIKVHSDNVKALSRINDRISGMKNDHANVKDAQELVDNMKSNGSFYVKEGDIKRKYKDSRGKEIIERYTAQDVANRVKTAAGEAADKKLSEEKIKAFTYLIGNDDEIKTYVKMLDNNGVSVDSYTKDNGEFDKGALATQQEKMEAINAEYYEIEQQYAEQEKKLASEESKATDDFNAALKNAGLDKESEKWIANEADNASRKVKNPQPEGFKPNSSVDSTTYTQYNTGFVLGSHESPSDAPRGGSRGKRGGA